MRSAPYSKDESKHGDEAALASDTRLFTAAAAAAADGGGPISAVKAWIENSGEVDAMIAIGEWFGPWFTAASFVYGLYKDWQQKKQDKETAKMIIREVVAAVNEMINRAVKSIETFIAEEDIKKALDTLRGHQRSLADLMALSADTDFENIDTVVVGTLLVDCDVLQAFFERILHENIDAPNNNSAHAAVMYGHIVDTTQLKNQTLAWQDKSLPHGTNKIAKEGVLRLQELLAIVLPAIHKTTDKQFSAMMFTQVKIDNTGHIIRPGSGGPEPPVGQRVNLFSYYFRGQVQGPTVVLGVEEEVFVGSTNKAGVAKEMERRKDEEYRKATEGLRAMGDEHAKAVIDLNQLILEEGGQT